jgi:hypothetical protein
MSSKYPAKVERLIICLKTICVLFSARCTFALQNTFFSSIVGFFLLLLQPLYMEIRDISFL